MRTSQPHLASAEPRLAENLHSDQFLFPRLHFADYTDDRVGSASMCGATGIDTHQIRLLPTATWPAARNASILWQEIHGRE